MTQDKPTFAQTLREEMKRGGWTHARLAQESGVSQASISGILSGHYRATLKTACQLAEVFRRTAIDMGFDATAKPERAAPRTAPTSRLISGALEAERQKEIAALRVTIAEIDRIKEKSRG